MKRHIFEKVPPMRAIRRDQSQLSQHLGMRLPQVIGGLAGLPHRRQGLAMAKQYLLAQTFDHLGETERAVNRQRGARSVERIPHVGLSLEFVAEQARERQMRRR